MNNKKTVVALLLVAIIGVVGLTIAYFANSTSVDNTFTTKEYGTTYTETFVSPDNWLPGDTTEKTLVATNTGEVDQAVRVLVTESWTTNNNGTLNGWIHSDGTKSTHTTQSELETDERVAILNLANTSDWTKVGNYYYYNYKLAPTESTTSLLESVTFNSKTRLDDTCTTTNNNGVTTTTCNSSGDDYDNATYTLTLTIETVQYNKYATAWSTGNTVNILEEKPIIVYGLNVNSTSKTYETGDKHQMFVFSHEATYQTPAQRDYRYIGDDPYNYVYFNCDDMSDQSSSTCEVWRIIGVFDVDDGTGNIEQRMKLVRGGAFIIQNLPYYNSNLNNDWTISPLNTFLNDDYYNQSGEASTYGLKVSARSIIGDVKYYLGSVSYNSTYDSLGTPEKIYGEERGMNDYNYQTYCLNHQWYEKCKNNYCDNNQEDDFCKTRQSEWIGEVALMYPSDGYMIYGKEVNETCYNNPRGCKDENAQTGWVYNSNIRDGIVAPNYTWLLSPRANNPHFVLRMCEFGQLSDDESNHKNGVRPVVYLKASVEIDSGTGTELDPYKLTY